MRRCIACSACRRGCCRDVVEKQPSGLRPHKRAFSRTVPVLSLRDELSSRFVTDNGRRRLYYGCDDPAIFEQPQFFNNLLKGGSQPYEYGRPIVTDPHIDTADDVGADDGPETDAGVEFELAGASLVQSVHHGPQVDKGG